MAMGAGDALALWWWCLAEGLAPGSGEAPAAGVPLWLPRTHRFLSVSDNPCRLRAQIVKVPASRDNLLKDLQETQRIAGIVRNLLTFARREKQSHSPAQLTDVITAVLSLIQTVMRHDQIELELAIPEDLPKIKCRSRQIQQVLMNLMTNARDALNERYLGYSPEKKLRIAAELITIQGRRFIRTTVEDTGPGIPEEIRDRIF